MLEITWSYYGGSEVDLTKVKQKSSYTKVVVVVIIIAISA